MMQLLKKNVILSFIIFLLIASVVGALFGYHGGGILQKGNTAMADLTWSMEPTAKYEYLDATDDLNVYLGSCTGKREKHLIDVNGKILERWPGQNLGNGYFEYYDGEKAGVADKDGNFLIKAEYDYIQAEGDYFIARGINERISFWNLDGECIWEEPQSAVAHHLGNNVFLVNQEGIAKSYLFYADSVKTKPLTKHVSFVHDDGKGGLVGHINGLYYHLDETFDVVEGAQVYEKYGDLSEGLRYVVLYDEKTRKSTPCYINTDGKIIITLDKQPDDAGTFSEGKALLQTGNQLRCIDKKGNELFTLKLKPQRSNFRIYPDFCYSEGLAAVSLDYEKYGYIDETGKFVIEPVLDMACDIQNGYAVVGIDGENYQYGILKFD